MQKADPPTASSSPQAGSSHRDTQASHVPSLISNARTRLFKAALALLAITITVKSFQILTIQPLQRGSVWSYLYEPTHPRQIRNPARIFLDVFQVIPPLLTVNEEGKLEITDGSSDATLDLVENDHATCRQTLVVHSFASSYN